MSREKALYARLDAMGILAGLGDAIAGDPAEIFDALADDSLGEVVDLLMLVDDFVRGLIKRDQAASGADAPSTPPSPAVIAGRHALFMLRAIESAAVMAGDRAGTVLDGLAGDGA
ncbi:MULTISPECIES: hypothetical protein [Protofrankia]|uniref:Uncharacterized protein n=1 Tax=Protofrankia coriariae TaxID=1562887 RepID=A0ABR5F273_9ACTN|nr:MULTISPECIES: hypothetical protein [Protofrankia]KLL10817.1 hypothetical protein FrCorBMG51_15480 [Protofrankia coriariae]ONH34019.1 hypothetical protein BL254_18445 [Protofrankia sp. BMG5.30]